MFRKTYYEKIVDISVYFVFLYNLCTGAFCLFPEPDYAYFKFSDQDGSY
jgi:hypothetical protein